MSGLREAYKGAATSTYRHTCVADTRDLPTLPLCFPCVCCVSRSLCVRAWVGPGSVVSGRSNKFQGKRLGQSVSVRKANQQRKCKKCRIFFLCVLLVHVKTNSLRSLSRVSGGEIKRSAVFEVIRRGWQRKNERGIRKETRKQGRKKTGEGQ